MHSKHNIGLPKSMMKTLDFGFKETKVNHTDFIVLKSSIDVQKLNTFNFSRFEKGLLENINDSLCNTLSTCSTGLIFMYYCDYTVEQS